MELAREHALGTPHPRIVTADITDQINALVADRRLRQIGYQILDDGYHRAIYYTVKLELVTC